MTLTRMKSSMIIAIVLIQYHNTYETTIFFEFYPHKNIKRVSVSGTEL